MVGTKVSEPKSDSNSESEEVFSKLTRTEHEVDLVEMFEKSQKL